MNLPEIDIQHLAERCAKHSVAVEANMLCVLIEGFPVPGGYDRTQSDLLVRLSPGYPDVAPDMWWFDPPLRRADGASIPATQHMERHLGRMWQRWSRHFGGGQWRSGVDCLESYLALIRVELQRCGG